MVFDLVSQSEFKNFDNLIILLCHSVRSGEAVTDWKRGTIITGRLTSLVALRYLPTEGVRCHSCQHYSPFS